MTMLVRRTRPFGDLLPLRDAMDRLFDDSFVRSFDRLVPFGASGALPIDVRSDAEAVTVEAALPGYGPDDVEITVEDGTLTISAEATSETETTEGEYLVRELSRGKTSRVVTLPSGLEADKATASFDNGVLRLRFPRAEETKPRQIRISPAVETTQAVDAPKA
jgi:HSP20 family protein